MRTAEAIRYFGDVYKMADALGCTRQAILKWGDEPVKLRQFQIEVLSKGQLKARRRTRRPSWALTSTEGEA